MSGFPYFIRNQWFKDILIRSKERNETNENFLILLDINDLRILWFELNTLYLGSKFSVIQIYDMSLV